MQPLLSGDPGTVGPYQIRGRLAGHQAGVVLLAHDQTGRAAAIAMLHTAAAGDPAARDRLAGGAVDLARTAPDRVLGRGLHDPLPWVATAYTDGAPATALSLLDAAALAGAGRAPSGLGDDGPTGPDFAPHWSGTPAAGTLSPPPPPSSPRPPGGGTGPAPANSRRSLQILAGCVAGAAALIVGAWWLVSAVGGSGDDVRAEPSASGPPRFTTGPTTGPSEPEATPGPTASPTPTWDGQDGPPGPVAGPTYGNGEPTYLMELKEKGFPFDFRAPGSWGCLKGSVEGRPETIAWVCMDESGIWSGEEPEIRARAEIWVEPCPAPCGPDEWAKLRSKTLDHPDGLRSTDDSTRYSEKVIDSGARLQLTMSHLFAEKNGRPTQHLGVEVTGAPQDVKTMQKLINELHLRSG